MCVQAMIVLKLGMQARVQERRSVRGDRSIELFDVRFMMRSLFSQEKRQDGRSDLSVTHTILARK